MASVACPCSRLSFLSLWFIKTARGFLFSIPLSIHNRGFKILFIHSADQNKFVMGIQEDERVQVRFRFI